MSRLHWSVPIFAIAILSLMSADLRSADPAASKFDPMMGAIKMSAAFEKTVFIVFAADAETIQAIPDTVPIPFAQELVQASVKNAAPTPAGYGPRGAWLEVKPGRYVVWAGEPGKRAARMEIEVPRGKETQVSAELSERESRFRIDRTGEKTGNVWGKK
ncbi:MAG: hypothetical protein ACJ8C4_00270 [Gemmataceae bacterium]